MGGRRCAGRGCDASAMDERIDEQLMAVALDEARRGLEAGEAPAGAVVVVAKGRVAKALHRV